MRLEDYEVKEFSDFLGLYDRGSDEQIPEDFLSGAFNVDFDVGEVKTRPGLSSSITLGYGGAVNRTANFLTAYGAITLILDTSGNLYTFSSRAGDTATTPRLTIAAATDFTAVQMLGKIFISFHDGKKGLTGINLKVFIPGSVPGSDEFRDAAGAAPSATAMNAADGAAGNVNTGRYLIAVAFITTSGHITPPGPLTGGAFNPTNYVSPGLVKIDLSAIPTGPSGTAQRQILITKANLDEYYFLPSAYGGLIPDNVTTTATLDFDDTTDIVDSADYLFDLLTTIPAAVGLQDFNGRLISFGEYANPSIARGSRRGEPEAFSGDDGIAVVSKDDGYELRNGLIIRNILYLCKENGVFAIVDNGDEPSGWEPIAIDQSVSVPSHGVASFFASGGVKFARDWSLIADYSGLLLIDGSIQKPPITFAINDIWQRINKVSWHKLVVVVDEDKHKIYCSIALDAATDNHDLLVGDYSLCAGNIPQVKGIKWSTWKHKLQSGQTPPAQDPLHFGVTDIGLTIVGSEQSPTLKIGSIDGGGKIWTVSGDDDDGLDIESYIDTALLAWVRGAINGFYAAKMRVTGTGTLLGTIRGYDDVNSASTPSIDISTSSGKEFLIRFNFKNEKARLKLRLASGRFIISDFKLYGSPLYSTRPA